VGVSSGANDPDPDIGRIEILQCSSLLPRRVCYPFAREAREVLPVKRRKFVVLLGGISRNVE
jgi:hypothetical protein